MSEQFNPNDAFNFFRNLWKPLEAPMQAMFPPVSEEEVERKIQELRVVENWLVANVNMLQMTIKTLEMQKAAFAAMKPADKPKPPPAQP
ncbi:PhaM family polyhydroxyalkanoate granule multifunctional regulatory protein [Chitinivorax sp. PXF-14]|uniref:PhaM family polyhydroxyalkanoate granule multifunctional regulatory protein n=1 Tax=Chitinivorax sp. PXF-14 TaxID=3230488 RepID=UPI0034650EE9